MRLVVSIAVLMTMLSLPRSAAAQPLQEAHVCSASWFNKYDVPIDVVRGLTNELALLNCRDGDALEVLWMDYISQDSRYSDLEKSNYKKQNLMVITGRICDLRHNIRSIDLPSYRQINAADPTAYPFVMVSCVYRKSLERRQ